MDWGFFLTVSQSAFWFQFLWFHCSPFGRVATGAAYPLLGSLRLESGAWWYWYVSLLLFTGSTGLGPRSAFQWFSKPFKAWVNRNPLKIAGWASFTLCYLSEFSFFFYSGSTIPPLLRFTLWFGHVRADGMRATPASPSWLLSESAGAEPGQLPLAVNGKVNISLKHRASPLSQECLKSPSRLYQLFFICREEKPFQNWGMGSMWRWDVSLSKLWAGWDVREGF